MRYNTETGEYTLHTGQYLTSDGKIGRIDPPWVQLEVRHIEQPEYDPAKQRISMAYEFDINPPPHDPTGINGTATEVWTVTDKTPEEIEAELAAAQAALEASAEYKITELEETIKALIEILHSKGIAP